MSIFQKLALATSIAMCAGTAHSACSVGKGLGAPFIGAETYPIELARKFEYASTEEIASFLKTPHNKLNPAFGATGGSWATRMTLKDYRVGRLPSGEQCVFVKHLEMKIGFEDVRVLLADVLKGYPCMRDHVLEHEYEHVELYKEQLQRSLKPMAQDIYRYLEAMKHVTVPNGKEPVKYARAFLLELSHTVQRDFREKTVIAEHAKIDSTITAHSHDTACNGQVSQITAALAAR